MVNLLAVANYHGLAKLVAHKRRIPTHIRRTLQMKARQTKQGVKKYAGLMHGDLSAGTTVRAIAKAQMSGRGLGLAAAVDGDRPGIRRLNGYRAHGHKARPLDQNKK